MAKVATFEKNAKRARMIKKYAKKRLALKTTIKEVIGANKPHY